MKSYLVFEPQDIYGRKTKVVYVLSASLGIYLGEIRWKGGWRQYCFYPAPDTVFSVGCMKDIQDEIQRLMKEWRDSKQPAKESEKDG